MAEAISLLVDADENLPLHANRFNGDVISPLDAPLIHNSYSNANIDFTLPRLPHVSSRFAFEVSNVDATLGLGGTVVLLKVDRNSEPWSVEASRSESASGGQTLAVHRLEAAEYAVQFVPWNSNFPPVFLGDEGAVYSLRDARLFMADDFHSGSYQVAVPALAPLQGVLHTRGHVFRHDENDQLVTVHGALSYAFDEAGEMVDFAVSDASGCMLFDRLGIGDYRITVTKHSCDFEHSSVMRSYDEFVAQLPQVTLECGQVVSTIETNGPGDFSFNSMSVDVTPQPADAHLHVNFSDAIPGQTHSAVGLRLFDMSGRLLHAHSFPAVAGGIDIDIARLEDGLYLLELRLGTRILRESIVVRR